MGQLYYINTFTLATLKYLSTIFSYVTNHKIPNIRAIFIMSQNISFATEYILIKEVNKRLNKTTF